MKKSELKKILKPLIKECIKEVIFEEGVLSTLVSEAVIGLSQTSQLLESKTTQRKAPIQPMAFKRNIDAKRKQMLDAVGRDSFNGVNLFEGTEALSNSENSGPSTAPLSGVKSSDPGIDISSLPGSSNWGKLI